MKAPAQSTSLPSLDAFTGIWVLRRDITDISTKAISRFVGTSEFVWQNDDLLCHEIGTLSLPNAPEMQATRSYIWRPTSDGIDVFFDDGRFFHTVTTGSPAVHDCDPDRYEGAYDFDAWPNWSLAWRVTGPRKNYEMISRYSRK